MADVHPTSTSKGESEPNGKDENVEAQKITTDLRLDFLKILTQLEGKKASFNLYKRKTPSSGIFLGSDRDILHFAVSEFESPTGLMKSATLRTTDIDCMTVPVMIKDAPESRTQISKN